MNTRKILIIAGIVLTVIVGILLLVSIFGGDDNNNDNNNNDDNNNNNNNDGPVTLEVWGLWESEAVMQPLIDKYESQNSNVQIVYTQKSFTQYEENLITRLQQGQAEGTPAPDIFRINNTWLSRYQSYLSPLPAEVMSGTDYAETFYSTAVNDFKGTDNNLYAVPLEIDGLSLFYNVEMFEQAGISEPPSDWDTLIEIAQQLTIKDANGDITQAGVAMGTSNNIMHSADILSLLMLQNGAEINQNFNTEVDLTSERAVSAIKYYCEMNTEFGVWSPDLRSDLEMFFSGDLAMMFAPSWRAFDILNSNPNIEFAIAPTPTLGSQPLYYSMYWGEAVSKDSDDPVEAWKFVKFLSEQQQLRDFYSNSVQIGGRAFGEPYSRQDMASELTGEPYVGAIVEMAPNMTSWRMGIQSFIEEELRNAINEVSINDVTPENAMIEAEEAINTELAKLFQTETE